MFHYGKLTRVQTTDSTLTVVAPTAASKPISEAPNISPDVKTTASFSISTPYQSTLFWMNEPQNHRSPNISKHQYYNT